VNGADAPFADNAGVMDVTLHRFRQGLQHISFRPVPAASTAFCAP
jgi:hypothetical protein